MVWRGGLTSNATQSTSKKKATNWSLILPMPTRSFCGLADFGQILPTTPSRTIENYADKHGSDKVVICGYLPAIDEEQLRARSLQAVRPERTNSFFPVLQPYGLSFQVFRKFLGVLPYFFKFVVSRTGT